MFVPASQEFINLCKAQVEILSQTLGAAWSAVYLTEGWVKENRKLIPVVVYPEAAFWQGTNNLALSPESWNQNDSEPKSLNTINSQISESSTSDSNYKQGEVLLEELLFAQHQIVLPLIHEEIVMGLLVTKREDRDWNDGEFSQIENIAITLTIACLLDKKQKWYKQQFKEQKKFTLNQKDRLDDLLHQLRNPLTALRTFSKLLLKRLLPEDRNHKLANSLLRESNRLQELLQQMDLYLDEMESEDDILILDTITNSEIEPAPFLLPGELKLVYLKVEEILNPLLVSAVAIAQERNLQIISEIPENLPLVKGDALALREVLNNLIDNALKYTPSGGKIYVRSLEKQTVENSFQGIAICDEGPGIPIDDQKHIFERHYRGIQSQGNIQGSGLGLAIAKRLVEQMQGEIELISPMKGKENNISAPGTVFIVWLLADKVAG